MKNRTVLFKTDGAVLEGNKKGIGLGNILSRVDYLRGKMNVDSEPGRGTTVIIDVPLGMAVA